MFSYCKCADNTIKCICFSNVGYMQCRSVSCCHDARPLCISIRLSDVIFILVFCWGLWWVLLNVSLSLTLRRSLDLSLSFFMIHCHLHVSRHSSVLLSSCPQESLSLYIGIYGPLKLFMTLLHWSAVKYSVLQAPGISLNWINDKRKNTINTMYTNTQWYTIYVIMYKKNKQHSLKR